MRARTSFQMQLSSEKITIKTPIAIISMTALAVKRLEIYTAVKVLPKVVHRNSLKIKMTR